jgi:hypothetical protein
MYRALPFLLLSGLSLLLFIDSLRFGRRQVSWTRRSPRSNKPLPRPWQFAVITAFLLLGGLLVLAGMTDPIPYIVYSAAAVGTVTVAIAYISLIPLTILVIISAIVFAVEFTSAERQKRPKHPAPEKSRCKGKPKPKRKNDWLQHDSA